ncbi:kelch-like protein 24a [Branchiostoma lanceolatum]|uniref:kelch-like protein 24a n=1 Tax=Branchiostoma lanceolatum TaxID=7740 RepID=UPI00345497B9
MTAADQEPHASTVRPRSYQDESYLHGFLGTVGDLQKAGVLQDVVLEVEDRRFPCHRLVLSAASPYFRAMFTSDMAESRQKTVVLQGLDAGMFGEILSYIYSGTLHVSLDKVQPLYQAADLLQLDYVRDTCSSYIAMNVESSTCLDLYKFANIFSLDKVRNRCLSYIGRQFRKFATSNEFCSLGVNQLTEIISHDELDVKEETAVWEAVVRWVQHSREDRQHHLPSILPHIRFNLLTSDVTVAILEDPLVREDPGSSEVIRKVVKKGNSNLKPRLGMTTEMAVLYAYTWGSRELLFMNPREGKYITCSYKTEHLPNFSAMAVTSDNDIYILQTKESEHDNQLSLLKYDHTKNVWEHECTSLVSKIQKYCYEEHILEVDGILYYTAVGPDEDRPLLEMRKYNRRTNQWQECSRLQLYEPIDDFSVLSCASQIYLLTSTDESIELYCYNPSQDRWCERSPPMNIDKVSSAVVLGTEIFCADRSSGDIVVYDTESERWRELPDNWSYPKDIDVNCANYSRNLLVLENQLHILLTCTNDENEAECLVCVYGRSAGDWRDLKAILPDDEYFVYGRQLPVARMYLPYLKVQGKDV